MKLNQKILKIVLSLTLILAILYWAITSLSPSTYSGTSLNFPIGHGIVSVNNTLDEAIPFQILGTSTRTFRLVSRVAGLSGNSTRVGTGSRSTQVFDSTLAPGISEFSVNSGTNISFVSNTPVAIEVTIYGLNEIESQAVIFNCSSGHSCTASLYHEADTRQLDATHSFSRDFRNAPNPRNGR